MQDIEAVYKIGSIDSNYLKQRALLAGVKNCLNRSLVICFFLGKVVEEKNSCYHQQSAAV